MYYVTNAIVVKWSGQYLLEN